MAHEFSGELEFPALDTHFVVNRLTFSDSLEVMRIDFESPEVDDCPYHGQELLGSLTPGGTLLSLKFYPYAKDRNLAARIEIPRKKIRFLFDSDGTPNLYLVGTWYDFEEKEVRSKFIGVLPGQKIKSSDITASQEEAILGKLRIKATRGAAR